MAYRKVTMIEVKELLRAWVANVPKVRIAADLTGPNACGLRLGTRD